MLADELGLEPSPELRELERMILAHDPGLAAPAAAVKKPPSNLPLQPTPFIGRERELAELVELIRSGRRRLVTLTGPGGSGRPGWLSRPPSRMADDYPDGVWWVTTAVAARSAAVLPSRSRAAIELAKGDVARHHPRQADAAR